MSVDWSLSACGLNCAACDFYKAGHGDKAKQQEIIDWFKRDYGKDIPRSRLCALAATDQERPTGAPAAR